jgi:hypothetical protein
VEKTIDKIYIIGDNIFNPVKQDLIYA